MRIRALFVLLTAVSLALVCSKRLNEYVLNIEFKNLKLMTEECLYPILCFFINLPVTHPFI